MPNRTGATTLVLGPDCLGSIFDDHKTVFLSKTHHLVHARHLAIEIYGNDCASPGRDPRGNVGAIEVVSDRIDIDENGGGTETSYRACGRKERVGSGDDLVPWTDVLGHKTGEESVTAG